MIRICAAVLYVTAAHSPSLAWGFGVRLPRVAPRHTRARVATSMGRGTKSKSSQATTDYYTILSDGSDAWRADGAVDILSRGGCGVLPTDTGYAFVTRVTSREGVERILRIKDPDGQKKPLSLICPSLSTVDTYTLGIDRNIFKLLKRKLPGPYTFILPASAELPKMIYKDGKKWKRKTIGIRIPDDPCLDAFLSQSDEPLLCSSVPATADGVQMICDAQRDGEAWCQQVDFIVDAGERPADGSTVWDLTEEEPVLVRAGLGGDQL